jgi:hypothetical protein
MNKPSCSELNYVFTNTVEHQTALLGLARENFPFPRVIFKEMRACA